MSFEGYVDGLVSECCTSDRPKTLVTLIHALPGIFPSDVRASLKRLGIRLTAGRESWTAPVVEDPVSHPADADWRFTKRTAKYLASQLEECARVVLLGAPSLFRVLSEPSDGKRVLLVDSNPEWGVALGTRTCEGVLVGDVSATPAFGADAAVVDPPWYETEARRFLAAARYALAPAGRVYMSFPPRGTRPEIEAELERLVRQAEELGLALEGIEHGVLRYRTPWFETRVLEAAGFPALGDWRCGDLAIFKCVGPPKAPIVVQPWDYPWHRMQLGRLSLRIRKLRAEAECQPRLVSLTEEDILPSVSRRHELYPRIDVWTAGHRVFGCRSPAILMEVVAAIKSGLSVHNRIRTVLRRELSPVEEEDVAALIKTLEHLERREALEYDAWEQSTR